MGNKHKLFISIIFAAAIALVLGFSAKAYADNLQAKEYKKALEEREDDFVREVRAYMNECGFENAGINLTKMYDENRKITYNLVINHYLFEYADDDKMNDMENKLYETADDILQNEIEAGFSY
ncbi:MAG: hypothetical protein K5776_02915 [Lachnospiraceae bacterium]|nr:hypothetical protein [Lachnospiraceae bacterium]